MNWLRRRWRAHQSRRKIRDLQRELVVLRTALGAMPARAVATQLLLAEALPVIVKAETMIAIEKARL